MIKTIISKFRIKFSDKSIDTEHYLALIYCFLPLLPGIITIIGFMILPSFSMNHLELLGLIILSIINGFFLLFYGKKMIGYFKKKRIMLGFISLLSVYLFLLFTLSWFSFFVGHLTNVLNLAWHMSENYMYIPNPGENIDKSIDMYKSVGELTTGLSQLICISFILNILVPDSLQKIEVSLKEMLKRLLLKFLFLFLFGVAASIFMKTNRDNFVVVSIIYGAILFFANPEIIIVIFSNFKNIEGKDISENTKKTFLIFKLLLSEMYIAWAISIFSFPSNSQKQFYIFISIFFIFLVLTMGTRIYLKSKGEDLFTNWIKNNDKSDISK